MIVMYKKDLESFKKNLNIQFEKEGLRSLLKSDEDLINLLKGITFERFHLEDNAESFQEYWLETNDGRMIITVRPTVWGGDEINFDDMMTSKWWSNANDLHDILEKVKFIKQITGLYDDFVEEIASEASLLFENVLKEKPVDVQRYGDKIYAVFANGLKLEANISKKPQD